MKIRRGNYWLGAVLVGKGRSLKPEATCCLQTNQAKAMILTLIK
jgi:hypothetical protein